MDSIFNSPNSLPGKASISSECASGNWIGGKRKKFNPPETSSVMRIIEICFGFDNASDVFETKLRKIIKVKGKEIIKTAKRETIFSGREADRKLENRMEKR
jgi:hypothetical protein